MLRKSQQTLLNELKVILDRKTLSTRAIAELRGDSASYHTNLRDRLFCLAELGHLKCNEVHSINGNVIERSWSLAKE